ncbi:MAG: DMT family transporter [Candidatus Hodarchaeales archaeon]
MIKKYVTDGQLGYIFIFIAIITWGLSTTLIDLGLKSNISVLSFLGFRFLLALLIFTPYILLKKLNPLINLVRNKWVWIIGLSESSGLIFQYYGQNEGVSPGLSALLAMLFLLLAMLFLVIVPFIAPFIIQEQIKKYHIYGIILGLIGVILVTSEGRIENLTSGSILGAILLLTAAFSYAIYIVATSRVTTIEIKDVDVFSLFYAVMIIITLTSLGIGGLTGELTVPPMESWIWIVLLVIFSTLIAFLAYFKALKTVPANTASILLILQLVIPFTIDIIFLDISYSNWIFAGAFTIVFAIVVVLIFSTRESREVSIAIAD